MCWDSNLPPHGGSKVKSLEADGMGETSRLKNRQIKVRFVALFGTSLYL